MVAIRIRFPIHLDDRSTIGLGKVVLCFHYLYRRMLYFYRGVTAGGSGDILIGIPTIILGLNNRLRLLILLLLLPEKEDPCQGNPGTTNHATDYATCNGTR